MIQPVQTLHVPHRDAEQPVQLIDSFFKQGSETTAPQQDSHLLLGFIVYMFTGLQHTNRK